MAPVHKGIDNEYVEVDPYDYSDWWLKVSRGAYRDYKLPDEGATWQRYQRWYRAMLEHPSFGKTAFGQGDC